MFCDSDFVSNQATCRFRMENYANSDEAFRKQGNC